MNEVILVINAGSSSIKFSLFASDDLNLIYRGAIDIHDSYSNFSIFNAKHEEILKQKISSIQYVELFACVFTWLHDFPDSYQLVAVGHRVVHGGTKLTTPTIINSEIIRQIEELVPLAPLHQEHNLDAIRIIAKLYPNLTQVACFDTSFHQTQNHLAKLFAIPRKLTTTGLVRYGFHGISYEYIASIITDKIGHIGKKRVIVAHLGNGASMCAMHDGKSIATSMGFTALDGLMMGSRCGHIDPGIILYLFQEKNYTVKEVSHLLYQESGLLGVSGISHDVRELLASDNPHAIEAIDLFCYRAALEFGSLSVALGGCDALVFTAGIGEHAAPIRQKICAYLDFYGIELDEAANIANSTVISTTSSPTLVGVLPTNEEYMLAKHTQSMINSKL